jgi:hypothetical protein
LLSHRACIRILKSISTYSTPNGTWHGCREEKAHGRDRTVPGCCPYLRASLAQATSTRALAIYPACLHVATAPSHGVLTDRRFTPSLWSFERDCCIHRQREPCSAFQTEQHYQAVLDRTQKTLCIFRTAHVKLSLFVSPIRFLARS